MAEHEENPLDLGAASRALRCARAVALLPGLSGARHDVLRCCSGEWSMYGGLGLGVLLTMSVVPGKSTAVRSLAGPPARPGGECHAH